MTKRDGRALWRALREQAMLDDIDELSKMSDDELDSYINENGGDARAIGAAGEAFAKKLLERYDEKGWHGDAGRDLERVAGHRAEIEGAAKPRLPRAELLRRLEAARSDPRFSAPVAALFHDKTEASTDEELQAMLDQIELLRRLEADRKK